MHIHDWAMVAVLLLAGCGGSPGDGSAAGACATPAGAQLLLGTVTAVHDGDTLTLQVGATFHTVRLDSIDAPELAQAFGAESRQTLADMLLKKAVQVAWSQRDRYDRTLGTVYTANCQDANLKMVSSGMAWFYVAYQCELPLVMRQQFTAAESSARSARRGLWSQAQATAPWVYRNGVDSAPPVCAP